MTRYKKIQVLGYTKVKRDLNYVISFYFECRMENQEQANQEEEWMTVDEWKEEGNQEEWRVVDECEEEANDAPSAPAGNGLMQFYYGIDE